MIRPAVTIVPAIWNEECTVGDRQGTALILQTRRERETLRLEDLGDVHREAGEGGAICDRQAEHQVLRARTVLCINHCIEVDSGFDVGDYWRSSAGARAEVTTGQGR